MPALLLNRCFVARLVHAPADPNGTLAAVEFFLELRAVLNHPTVDGGVIELNPAFLHQFFDVARAQRVR